MGDGDRDATTNTAKVGPSYRALGFVKRDADNNQFIMCNSMCCRSFSFLFFFLKKMRTVEGMKAVCCVDAAAELLAMDSSPHLAQ